MGTVVQLQMQPVDLLKGRELSLEVLAEMLKSVGCYLTSVALRPSQNVVIVRDDHDGFAFADAEAAEMAEEVEIVDPAAEGINPTELLVAALTEMGHQL